MLTKEANRDPSALHSLPGLGVSEGKREGPAAIIAGRSHRVRAPAHVVRCAATIFDIYSEALSNVAYHAGASRVAIALTITPHEVTLVVRDNGIGLGNEAPASGAGGLAGMRARSQTHKGFCEVTGARNAGTTVTVSLPIPRAP